MTGQVGRLYKPCLRCGSERGFIYQRLLLCTPCRNVLTRDERLDYARSGATVPTRG